MAPVIIKEQELLKHSVCGRVSIIFNVMLYLSTCFSICDKLIMEQKFVNSETGSINPEMIGYQGFNQPTAILVARLVARTMLLITILICSVILLTVYLQSRTNKCLIQDYKSSESGSYFQSSPTEMNHKVLPLKHHIPINIKMSGRASDLMNGIRNDNEKVNCIIERKAANQIITSDSKQLVTPFGNITTDPKLIHLTGEKLIFSCGDKESNTEEAINPSIKHISRLIIIGRNLSHEKNGQPEQISLQPTTNTSNGDAIAKNLRAKRQVGKETRMAANKECTCKCAC